MTNAIAAMSLAEELNFIVAPKAQKYDDATDELKANFDNVDLKKITSIKFSANSYGTDACIWI